MAAGLVLSAVTGAQAIDFKAKGQWIMNFDYGQNGKFNDARGWNGSEDEFEAEQRVRLQLDAVASEALSGTVFFEIGDQVWGQNSTGGALGADGKMVEVKRAYIDWMPPATDLKVRMGIQGIAFPSFTTGSMVMDNDVAGVVASYKFTDNVSVTALWARPFNDNFGGYGETYKGGREDYRANYMDNMDVFALMVPLTFDGLKVTPWGAYAAIGPNTFKAADGDPYDNTINGSGKSFAVSGLLPAGGARHRDGDNAMGKNALGTYIDAWWAGLTGDVTMFDPFRFAWDFTYGSVQNHNESRYNRSGWILSGLFEYKMDWGIPGIVGWYASGDDGNPANGSERLPGFGYDSTNQFSSFAFGGEPYLARDGVMALSMAGTWGVGARIRDLSFIEDLKHTIRINWMGGTNAPKMGRKLADYDIWANSDKRGMEAMYLTTKDQALELSLRNTYSMYENFDVIFEADYIAMWLEDRGNGNKRIENASMNNKTKDAWNLNLAFVYSF
ncbi:MAG: outer membrane homotrimeric porin [Desulfovibrio sp.]|nr:outer membrane homotrimeric porin [Desulfovibrio sp.]